MSVYSSASNQVQSGISGLFSKLGSSIKKIGMNRDDIIKYWKADKKTMNNVQNYSAFKFYEAVYNHYLKYGKITREDGKQVSLNDLIFTAGLAMSNANFNKKLWYDAKYSGKKYFDRNYAWWVKKINYKG